MDETYIPVTEPVPMSPKERFSRMGVALLLIAAVSLVGQILAMALMLCDHLWASVASDQAWLTHIGRIAFPIFAFQIAEGFARTHDRKRYLLRMLAFAAVSEIPFNLFYAGTAVYPFHQNVMFTFVLAILLLLGVEKFRAKGRIAYLL